MLAPELAGRDLRISSQTGSGKTVAIGLVLRDDVQQTDEDTDDSTKARPRALVVAPTRELAKQVEEELAWLFAPLRIRIASVTGGGGYRDELRAFRAKPAVIVGTPGRLLDHLKRGAIDASSVASVVLDEADRMLDMGFRDDLEAILGYTPKEHRTHLMSATFPREVRALADRVQRDPVPIEGTPLGTANADIEHLVHLVEHSERLAAIVNLILASAGAQTLVFARTRADVAELTEALDDVGFNVAMLSGEMEQAERNRALAAFKRGGVDALVATDVAARGIDVQDVTRVLHVEPPSDPDAYTHRSGRTGRAGRKGTSSVLVTRSDLGRVTSLLNRARVRFQFAPVPSADAIREARDEGLYGSLTADFVEGEAIDPRSLALAERILASSEPARAIGRLAALALRRGQVEPREITPIAPPAERPRAMPGRPSRNFAESAPYDRGARNFGGQAPRDFDRGPRAYDRAPREHAPREHAPREAPLQNDGAWVPFRVSWGESHGATPPRLVAMMCRRGEIRGQELGAIRVGRTSSVVEVAASVAADFERAASKPDPRDPRVHVRRWSDEPVKRAPDPRERPSAARLPKERPSAAKIPAERPSAAKIPAERPSAAKIPAERPSAAKIPKDHASAARIPAERPSAARIPKDRPSVAKDRPSAPKDRPSVAKDRPSAPKDRPSVAKDRPSAPKDRPSAPKDRPSVGKDRPGGGTDRPSEGKDRPSGRKDRPGGGKDRSPAPKDRPYVVVRDRRAPATDRPAPGGPPQKGPPPKGGQPGQQDHRPSKYRPKSGKRPPWAGGNRPPKRRPR